jgi:shikimate dehydrogenase
MRKFGIIGRPVSHSASGYWFSMFFEQHAIDAQFQLFEPSHDEMLHFDTWVSSHKLNGFLITIPFKKDVIPFLDEIDSKAAAIGAVNVVLVNQTANGSKLSGFNTDYLASANEIFRLRPSGFRKAILLGNGGAAAAVAYALNLHHIEFQKVSRNASSDCIAYADLHEIELAEADLIINATSLGMHPQQNECPPINYSKLNRNALAYDLIYNPSKTLFLQKCAAAGCQTENGKGMVELIYRHAVDLWKIL